MIVSLGIGDVAIDHNHARVIVERRSGEIMLIGRLQSFAGLLLRTTAHNADNGGDFFVGSQQLMEDMTAKVTGSACKNHPTSNPLQGGRFCLAVL